MIKFSTVDIFFGFFPEANKMGDAVSLSPCSGVTMESATPFFSGIPGTCSFDCHSQVSYAFLENGTGL